MSNPDAALLWWRHLPERPLHVFVHGFAQRGDSWAEVAQHTGKGAAMVSVHLPGHHPQVPVVASRFEDVADQLARELVRARLHDCHLVGYSLGARVALSLLTRQPKLVARATLISVHPGLSEEQDREARAETDARWATMLRTQGIAAFVQAWEEQALFASQARVPGQRLGEQRAARLSHDPHTLADVLDVTSLSRMPEYWSALPDLEVPVQLVAGEEDLKFKALAERAARTAPNATLTLIPECGHNPLLEQPAALAQALADFAP